MKPEPLTGNPGIQTSSNRFNKYSGKPGYSKNLFSFTIIKGYRKRRTGRTTILCRTDNQNHQKQQKQSSGYSIIRTRNYKMQ